MCGYISWGRLGIGTEAWKLLMHSQKYLSPDATPSPFPVLSPSIILIPTVCL